MTCHETGQLLHPYVDGELDLTTSLAVEEHLAGCADCTTYFQNLQDLRQEIAGAALHFQPKPGLVRRIEAQRQPRRRQALWAMAAAALLALLSIPATYLAYRRADDAPVFDAHIRSLMASHLVDVPSSDHHTVKPWFQGRLNFSPAVPELAAQGFVLTGGRLDVLRGRPTAAIVYKRRDHVINLFIEPTSGADSSARARSREGYNLVELTSGGMNYWAVSDLNAQELRHFADLAGGR